jgi:hypothetical protein
MGCLFAYLFISFFVRFFGALRTFGVLLWSARACLCGVVCAAVHAHAFWLFASKCSVRAHV